MISRTPSLLRYPPKSSIILGLFVHEVLGIRRVFSEAPLRPMMQTIMNLLDVFNKSQLKKNPIDVRPGDTVKLYQRLKEGDKTRLQPFEGLIVARKHGKGSAATITIRKVSGGIGIEKIIPIHSPTIEKVEILRRAKVRRAKLYYIREKAAKEVRRKMKSLFVAKGEQVQSDDSLDEVSEK